MHVQAIHQSIYAKNAACRETEVTAVGDTGKQDCTSVQTSQ